MTAFHDDSIGIVHAFEHDGEADTVFAFGVIDLVLLDIILPGRFQLLAFIPELIRRFVSEEQFESVLGAAMKHGDGLGSIRMMDAEDAIEPVLSRGLDPRIFYIGAVGKGVFAMRGIGCVVNALITEAEIAFETVAVRVLHYALSDRAFEFLANLVLELPFADVLRSCLHEIRDLMFSTTKVVFFCEISK